MSLSNAAIIDAHEAQEHLEDAIRQKGYGDDTAIQTAAVVSIATTLHAFLCMISEERDKEAEVTGTPQPPKIY